MATAIPNSNINIPFSSFLDPVTGRPSQEWLMFLMNPTFISANLSAALPVTSGGTGLTTIPTNGKLLIGNGTGYTLNTLTASTGITVTNGAGTITVTNSLPDLTVVLTGAGTTVVTGTYPNFTITSNDAFVGTVTSVSWTGGIVSVATPTTTPAFTVAGTSGGIPYFSSGTAWASSGVLTASRIVLGGGAGAAPTVLGSLGTTTTVLHGNAAGAPTFGAVSLTADVSGILPIANGGTGTSTAGVSATIVTAKLTSLGADGSMTFTNGLLTAQTPAT
jgi:hypothetical protein